MPNASAAFPLRHAAVKAMKSPFALQDPRGNRHDRGTAARVDPAGMNTLHTKKFVTRLWIQDR
jgi:hypothetical protein